MEFMRYLSLKRFGNTEVENINIGKVYVFPKLDGTNASVWIDQFGVICAGSRNRKISVENDNGGFMNWLTVNGGVNSENIHDLLDANPDLRLFGEWLIPHTIKDYLEDSWRTFNVFDVYSHKEERYLSYEEYKPLLDEFGVNYIPCQKIIVNGEFDDFVHQAQLADYCLPSGRIGEGVVLKNYRFVNKYGRYAAAKVVNSEFKASNRKEWGAPVQENRMTEEALANLMPSTIPEKVYAKIVSEKGGFDSKDIPRLLDQSYFDFFHEELWDAVKKIKAKSVDFNTLKSFIYKKTKEALPQIF